MQRCLEIYINSMTKCLAVVKWKVWGWEGAHKEHAALNYQQSTVCSHMGSHHASCGLNLKVPDYWIRTCVMESTLNVTWMAVRLTLWICTHMWVSSLPPISEQTCLVHRHGGELDISFRMTLQCKKAGNYQTSEWLGLNRLHFKIIKTCSL